MTDVKDDDKSMSMTMMLVDISGEKYVHIKVNVFKVNKYVKVFEI